MGYALIPLMLSIALVIHHVFFTDASRGSKLVLSAAVLGSLVIWRFAPQWLIVATLLQSAAGIYMLVYLKVRAAGGLR